MAVRVFARGEFKGKFLVGGVMLSDVEV